jgi:hypothetical protein
VIHDAGGREHLALVAEIVRPASPALARSLRAYLRRVLPRYMLPAALGMLRNWPRTTSCKADTRTCLTELERAVAQRGRGDYFRGALGFEPLTERKPMHAPQATGARP